MVYSEILQLRPLAIRHLTFEISADSQLLFWHDPWINGIPLIHIFDKSIISITCTSPWAKVSDFIVDRAWNLPQSNHSWVIDMRNIVNPTRIANVGKIKWDSYLQKFVTVSSIRSEERRVGKEC